MAKKGRNKKGAVASPVMDPDYGRRVLKHPNTYAYSRDQLGDVNGLIKTDQTRWGKRTSEPPKRPNPVDYRDCGPASLGPHVA